MNGHDRLWTAIFVLCTMLCCLAGHRAPAQNAAPAHGPFTNSTSTWGTKTASGTAGGGAWGSRQTTVGTGAGAWKAGSASFGPGGIQLGGIWVNQEAPPVSAENTTPASEGSAVRPGNQSPQSPLVSPSSRFKPAGGMASRAGQMRTTNAGRGAGLGRSTSARSFTVSRPAGGIGTRSFNPLPSANQSSGFGSGVPAPAPNGTGLRPLAGTSAMGGLATGAK
jgi:hypothetical protein